VYLKLEHPFSVTYLKRSLPAFAVAANTQSEPIELPNSTEPSAANSLAKSAKVEHVRSTQYYKSIGKPSKLGEYKIMNSQNNKLVFGQEFTNQREHGFLIKFINWKM